MILVTGATGQQGGAVVRRLIADGRPVRALVRDRTNATGLRGAELVVGDMRDRASLDAAMAGVQGVFSAQPAVDGEVGMGINVAEAALAAGVSHLVYTSVAGVERVQGIERWETKGQIERQIRSLGLPATILRPVKFMENLAGPGFDAGRGRLADIWEPERPAQVIAVQDIGAFAALAFADPRTYVGLALEIAGDELPHKDMVAAISESLGRTVNYEHNVPDSPIARKAVAFVVNGGWQADIPALRAMHPGLLTFPAWLERTGRHLFR